MAILDLDSDVFLLKKVYQIPSKSPLDSQGVSKSTVTVPQSHPKFIICHMGHTPSIGGAIVYGFRYYALITFTHPYTYIHYICIHMPYIQCVHAYIHTTYTYAIQYIHTHAINIIHKYAHE